MNFSLAAQNRSRIDRLSIIGDRYPGFQIFCHDLLFKGFNLRPFGALHDDQGGTFAGVTTFHVPLFAGPSHLGRASWPSRSESATDVGTFVATKVLETANSDIDDS